MRAIYDQIARVSPTTTVLVVGDNAFRQGLVARTDAPSRRRNGPFVRNCGAISPCSSSELFGHERGSFTGADRRHKGRVRAGDARTLGLSTK
jgi:DNA-binding NtrC family response regulator